MFLPVSISILLKLLLPATIWIVWNAASTLHFMLFIWSVRSLFHPSNCRIQFYPVPSPPGETLCLLLVLFVFCYRLPQLCHNFLSTRSCFHSCVSDGRYLMVYMTLGLLYMPAQIIQMMTFTQIMAIWTLWITP